jgi:RNA 2',3'-cyclic 3'-phosphodiesterase
MKKRIFISIGLPDKIKNKIAELQEEIDRSFSYSCGSSPIKWTKKDNLHITLFFVGYLEINDLIGVFDIVGKVADEFNTFDLKLENISFAPKGKFPPKMVWVNAEKSEYLGKLQKQLETALLSNPNIILENEEGSNKNFSAHITTGRIVQWQFTRMEPEEIPDIEKDFSVGFKINSIEVMESELKKGGAQYTILKSFNFKD